VPRLSGLISRIIGTAQIGRCQARLRFLGVFAFFVAAAMNWLPRMAMGNSQLDRNGKAALAGSGAPLRRSRAP
jgi:hypothetical protein